MSQSLLLIAIYCIVVAVVFCARLMIRARRSSYDEALDDESRWMTIACFALIGALGFLILSIRTSQESGADTPTAPIPAVVGHRPEHNPFASHGHGSAADLDVD